MRAAAAKACAAAATASGFGPGLSDRAALRASAGSRIMTRILHDFRGHPDAHRLSQGRFELDKGRTTTTRQGCRSLRGQNGTWVRWAQASPSTHSVCGR